MNFLKKIIKSFEQKQEEKIVKEQPVFLTIDDSFVHYFIELGGKFLYCQNKEDVISNLQNILEENNLETIAVKDKTLHPFFKALNTNTSNDNKNFPFFTTCEFLIAENGSILFSSNQLEEQRLTTLTNDFIVFATTSQIVKNTDESLTGIKFKHKVNLPTNICSIKDYNPNKKEDNFLNYSANNSKNLYLLLLEDL